MAFNSSIYRRRSIRLHGYDYRQTGIYFVTICAQHQACLFGDIVNGNMVLNAAGQMIEQWYLELEQKFSDIQCGDFVCMPNHIHCILLNVGADLRVCPDTLQQGEHIGSPLPRVVQWFKTMTTNAYIHGVKHQDWLPFNKRLWQRNYYEHIVRNEADLVRIQHYIQNNPILWQEDSLYPQQR